MEKKEEWRKVNGYGDRFAVSNHGRLMNYKTGKILSQTISRNGYLCHATKIGGRNGKHVCMRVHRLVAESFLPRPTDGQHDWAKETSYGKVFVNHIDGDKKNNHYTNLEWCTGSENMKHAANNGLLVVKSGEEHWSSVLNLIIIEKIKNEYIPYSRTNGLRALCRKYGLKHTTVSNALNGVSKYIKYRD